MSDQIRIEGTCNPDFAAVRRAFEDNFEHRGEIGSSVCVYKDGEKVVDLWGGYVDRQKQLPWDKDTIVIMNSVSKSMSALCVHMLIDRGVIGFDEPVANYWPEFAQAGKEAVLVRHVLSHTDGVIFSGRCARRFLVRLECPCQGAGGAGAGMAARHRRRL